MFPRLVQHENWRAKVGNTNKGINNAGGKRPLLWLRYRQEPKHSPPQRARVRV